MTKPFGYSTKLIYDEQAYNDKIMESTGPLHYTIDPNRTTNCRSCLSTLGPRASLYGEGISTNITNNTNKRIAPVHDLVDIESILSNRNVKHSKTKMGSMNNIDVTKFPLFHSQECDSFLNPLSSRLTYPTSNFRSIGIDRFYDLDKNPQSVIFWDSASNTRLESKDNYVVDIPYLRKFDPTLPTEFKSNGKCGKNTCN